MKKSNETEAVSVATLIDEAKRLELITKDLKMQLEATELHQTLTVAESRLKELKDRIIIEELDKLGLEGATGMVAQAKINHNVVYNVPADRFDDLYAYIKANDAFDLLQRKVKSTSIAALIDEGKTLPFVEKVIIKKLSLTKR